MPAEVAAVRRFEAGYGQADADRDDSGEEARVTVDKLNELQQMLDEGRPLDQAQCAMLIAEIWRLKTVIAGKTMEARAAHDEARELELSLDRARMENENLRRELEDTKEIHGLPACDLENRWSNCAVRMKKRAAEKARRAGEKPPR
jgi:predicted RNase H-like nuclease (RuvC/YqgF family)